MIKKKFFSFLLLSLLVFSALFAVEDKVLIKPRKVYVVKTEHFDVLFPKESMETADLLVKEADRLYERAKKNTGFVQDLHIPVVISPDSDKLSVTYTQSPYNRIVIFDSVADADEALFKDNLLGLFYHEIYKALSKAIRTPFYQRISKFAGDSLEPVTITNIPFSFVEGRAYLFEGQTDNPQDEEKYGRYNDAYFLQILSQAKYENKFPNYYECSVSLDIYPGNEILYAATSAFIAYLIQAYGYEKFEDYWEESGAFHLYFMAGIFYSVYKESINKVWKDFVTTIPLPANLEKMEELTPYIGRFFENDREGLYQHFIYTDYGYVWYDGIRHEVDLYDPNSMSDLRQLLFLADKVDSMVLSPDGRYLAVSYRQIKSRDSFEKRVTWIYDLRERDFLDYEFCLRDAAIVLSDEGQNLLAGVNVESKHPLIQIYTLPEDEDDSTLIYEKSFGKNTIPSSLCPAGNGKFTYLLTKDVEKILVQENFINKSIKTWKLKESSDHELNISNLRFVKTISHKNQNSNPQNSVYSFQYLSDSEAGFVRMGYISLDEEYQPKEISLMQDDLPGGIYYPFIKDDSLYYSAKKLQYNELSYIKTNLLSFKKGSIENISNLDLSYTAEEITFSTDELNGHELSEYWPIKYMFPLSFMLFLPVNNISIENGASKWPGLGFSLVTNSDPFMNNEFTFSASWSHLDTDFVEVINAPMAYLLEEEYTNDDSSKDKSAAFFYKNTSTPVDIKAGSMLKFNLDGEYTFEALAGTTWNKPIGMSFSNLNFDIVSYYSASTDYYDPRYTNSQDSYASKSNWPAFDEAFEYFEASAKCFYSNIHQYGISPYEKRGFLVGGRLYFFWDIYSYRILEPSILDSASYGDELYPGTQVTGNELASLLVQRVTQLNIGLFAEIDIPRLNPLHMKYDLVLSLPAKIDVEFLNTTGTALRLTPEVLLLAWEPHDGIRLLLAYFSRIGLKFGYDFRLDYDTMETALPDIRRENYIYDTLESSYVNDSFYLTINMDFSSPIAYLSNQNMGFEFKFIFYPKTKGSVFSFSFVSTF